MIRVFNYTKGYLFDSVVIVFYQVEIWMVAISGTINIAEKVKNSIIWKLNANLQREKLLFIVHNVHQLDNFEKECFSMCFYLGWLARNMWKNDISLLILAVLSLSISVVIESTNILLQCLLKIISMC